MTCVKIRKAAGRNEKDEAARLDAQTPVYTLHHLVRERYPRFVDALSDLDDALALIYLFAALPSAHRIKTTVTKKAKELSASWGAYCAITSSISKSFVSVKGVYFEANINTNSQDSSTPTVVRWVVPHSFTQHLPTDVDYRVMLTFFEFYEILLGFVLFKLYNDIGVRYPIALPKDKERLASSPIDAYLFTLNRTLRDGESGVSSAVSDAVEKSAKQNYNKQIKQKTNSKELVKKVGAALHKISNDDSSDDDDDDDDGNENTKDVEVSGPLKAALENLAEEQRQSISAGNNNEAANKKSILSDDALKRKSVFSKLTFFLSREVPRGYLELICLSYGGKVGWEGDDSPISVKDPSITHHIVDRPKLPFPVESLPKSREYVQPQWILDSANNNFLLPCSKYAVGCELPPHLSPWVDNEEEGYKPAYAEEIEKIIAGEVMEDEDEQIETQGSDTNNEKEENDEESEDEDEIEEKEKNRKAKKRKKEVRNLFFVYNYINTSNRVSNLKLYLL